jgi:hypothetical protein
LKIYDSVVNENLANMYPKPKEESKKWKHLIPQQKMFWEEHWVI